MRHTHTIRLHEIHLDVYQRKAEISNLIQTHTECIAAIFPTILTQALQNYDRPIKEGFFSVKTHLSHYFFFFVLLPCNVINVFQIPTYYTIYLLDKTHLKIRTSHPLKFFNITLLHVSILLDHHQGVNVPIYEFIEYFYIC